MITISLCMIVRDEEQVLARCLDSVMDLVDEIMIVDTGSVDHTKEIAKRYTHHVYDFPWIDDFAAARNASFEKATMDYCMWLDADDVITEENRERFKQLKTSLNCDVDVVMLPYQSSETFCCNRERLLRRKADFRWKGRVHEAIAPAGNILYGDAAVTHRPIEKQRDKADREGRNLRIYRTMLRDGEPLTPRDQYYYGRELCDHQLYSEAIPIFQQFIQNPYGWYVNQVDACRLLASCHRQMGETEQILPALLQALELDVPDAGLCCDIGGCFLHQNQYPQAIWWYERALACRPERKSGKFFAQDEYGYIPALQLCVCYDRLGQLRQAEQYNELAAQFHPEAEAVQHNRRHFREKLQK